MGEVDEGVEASFGDCLEGEMLLNSEDWSINNTRGIFEKGGIESRMARDIYLHVKLVVLSNTPLC